LDQAIPFDPYGDNRAMGAFILVDRMSNATVGCGMINFALRRAANIHHHVMKVDQQARALTKQQKPCVLWFTGLSGAGKSTVADLVEQRLHAIGHHTMLLDGDNVRFGLNRDLGFSDEDRVENIRRVGEVSKLMTEAGLITLVSFISPFQSERKMARDLLEDDEFFEIFVDAPLDVCEQRDPKGLYKKARAGEIPNFTGIGSDYEPPENPELRLAAGTDSADDLATQVITMMRAKGIIAND
jgi:bifunctional enzyme CysN/CysC